MANLYTLFKRLLPQAPLQAGTALSSSDGSTEVELPNGQRLLVRGGATVGDQVFLRDGVIEGSAPSLPVEFIEV